jgi:hypothetical protein
VESRGEVLMLRRVFLPSIILAIFAIAFAQETQPKSEIAALYPTLEAKEKVLHSAKIIKSKKLGHGITNPLKLTMKDGDVEFYAVFKDVDMRKAGMTQLRTGAEMDFKDSWQFDVAAYELDKLLGLDMVPVTIERKYNGEKGAVQWWVENAMTEGDRKQKGMEPPDKEAWNQAIFKVRMFDNLIYNIDRNLGNLLITPDWKVWMIDHSRSFKNLDTLKADTDLSRFSISFVNSLKKLDAASVKDHCGKYLTVYEIQAMMKRRDAILALYDKLHAEKGDSILFP